MVSYGKASALRDELSWTLIFVALFSSCGAWTFGWDNAWWGGILGNAYFGQHFGAISTTVKGVTIRTLSPSQQSAGTGLGTAGIMVGCMLAGQVAHWGGRRLCFYVVALISFFGVIIEATAGIGSTGRFYQMAAGKFVVGVSIGVASIAVPLYQAECAPAAIRGALVNSYVTIQALGTWMAFCCLYTLVNSTGQKVWLVPICIQMLAPLAMVSFGWMLPESPRWLVEKGRMDEARATLVRLHSGKRGGYDPDADLLNLQLAKEEAIGIHGESKWLDCFRSTDLKRTLIVLGVQCLQQGQGISFMSSYLVVFLLQLGFSQVYLILVIVGALLTVLTSVGFFTQDFIGRRALLMIGGAIQAICLISVGGLTFHSTLSSAKVNASVGLIFIWLIAFTQSWTNIPWTVSAELPASRLRDKTLTIGAWGGYGVGLMIGFVNPFLQDVGYADLGGGVGFIYGSVSVISVIFSESKMPRGVLSAAVYLFLPELKGVSLETVDAMFDAGIAPRKMGTHPMRYQVKASVETVQGPELGLDAKKQNLVEHIEDNKEMEDKMQIV
ncbi:hypothetical protein P7C73_g2530, partial [Tremellales sp. Uapishka_1]